MWMKLRTVWGQILTTQENPICAISITELTLLIVFRASAVTPVMLHFIQRLHVRHES